MKIEQLMLLFTYGGKLETWEQYGLIDRELSYYEKMLDAGLKEVFLMTYGNGRVQSKIDSRFQVLTKKWVNHDFIFSLLAPFANWQAFRQCKVIKSNQSQGAWVGWMVKALMPGKKLVVRCGWVRTDEMMCKDEGRAGLNLWWHKQVEYAAFKFADAIIVVSEIDRDYIADNYKIDLNKFFILPNSVDVNLYQFVPINIDTKKDKRILLIGRLVEMKNFQSVLLAVDSLDSVAEVVIVGDGPYRNELESIAKNLKTRIRFLAAIPNDRIPQELADSDIFVLPQKYASGMPKVILEAMAVGVPVVCSDIKVHRNLIDDGKNGFLCGGDVGSIHHAINRVCTLNPAALNNLTRNARNDVENSYDMTINACRELSLFETLILEEKF